MPRRWLVNTSNNRLVGVIDDDDAAWFRLAVRVWHRTS